MVESLIGALKAGLSLWQSKEARKYMDEVIKWEKKWHEEYNKTRTDDATLDYIELQLRIISKTFCSEIGTANLKD